MKRLHNGNGVYTSTQQNLDGTCQSNAQIHSPIDHSSAREFESVQIWYQLKGSSAPSHPRLAKITVTPGVIDVHAKDNKFPPIRIKISDLVRPPKLPSNKNMRWLILDFVKTADSTYLLLNLEVDPAKMTQLVDTLMYAWAGKTSDSGMSNRAILSNVQNQSSIDRSTQRVFESVQVVCKNKCSALPISSSDATISVTPGVIDIHANDDKFRSIRIKISELVKKPKRQLNGWISLDFIQKVTVTISYIDLRVADNLMLDQLVDILLFAWSGSPSDIGLFDDSSDVIEVVMQNPLSNAVMKPAQLTPVTRNVRPKITVNDGASTSQQVKPAKRDAALQNLFDAYNREMASVDKSLSGNDDPSVLPLISPNPILPTPKRALKTTTKTPRTVSEALRMEPECVDLMEEGNGIPMVAATEANVLSVEAPATEAPQYQNRRDIDKEFNLMVDEVCKLDEKNRKNVMNILKTLVMKQTEKNQLD